MQMSAHHDVNGMKGGLEVEGVRGRTSKVEKGRHIVREYGEEPHDGDGDMLSFSVALRE